MTVPKKAIKAKGLMASWSMSRMTQHDARLSSPRLLRELKIVSVQWAMREMERMARREIVMV